MASVHHAPCLMAGKEERRQRMAALAARHMENSPALTQSRGQPPGKGARALLCDRTVSPVNVREDTLRSIGVALIGMAVAISMVGLGVTEPAVAKVRKGCRDQQQQRVNQTGECNDIIIENLDRGPSSTGHFYRSNSQKAKKLKSQTKSN
jgi:hypothetical protein